MSKHPDDEQFWDDLASVVDGEPAAVAAYQELLVDSIEHRDARFEAEHAARRLGEAGDDWEHPADLDARIVAAMQAQQEALPGDASPTTPEPVHSREPAPRPEIAIAPDAAPEPSPTSGQDGKGRRSGRASLYWLAAGLSVAAAVGLAFAGALLLASEDGATDVVASDLLSARLGRVARAADDGVMGVSVRGPGAGDFVPMTEGAEVGPGATVRTDDRSRVELILSDGTRLVLDHGTELALGADAPRQLTLSRGELVADVAHLEEGPRARIDTPHGTIEVIGTKFLLTAAEEASTVRVTRGSVMAHAGGGASADILAGEEGVLEGGTVTVTPAMEIAKALSWSELGEAPEEGSVAGLGELRAHRPGEREETERPLSLSEQKITVRIVGTVARTEIEQTFRNDGPDTLEGVYRFPLPSDARIASLALDVDGEWEAGAFVSRDRGQRIWRGVIRNATPTRARARNEEFIWVPGPWRDPALLEWQRGGQFELKIFPIPAHGERRVRLAYTQNIGPNGRGRRYVYPLPHSRDGSTRVGRLTASIHLTGVDAAAPPEPRGYAMTRAGDRSVARLDLEARDFVPAGDLAIDYRLDGEGAGLRYWTYAGRATVPPPAESREDEPEVAAAQREIHADRRGYVAFAIRPELPAWGRGQSRDYALVLDASQSMVGERWERAAALAGNIVAEMDRRDRFVVLACDATCQSYRAEPEAPSSRAATNLRSWLADVRPAGASDLVRALSEGAELITAARQGDRAAHVIYIGDGMPSVGSRRPSSIAAEVTSLVADPQLSLSTVGIGGDADALVLTAVARAGGGQHIPYVPGERAGAAALAVLETTFGAALQEPRLRMPEGITAIAPARLPTIRAGQEVIVVGRLTSDEVVGEVVLEGRVGDRRHELRYPVSLRVSRAAGNAFVPRQWAAATIDELELSGKGSDEPRIVALSKAFGVMSRHTSLLVLESEAMFRAFGVDRSAPTVEWTGEGEMEEGQSEDSARAPGQSSVRRGLERAALGMRSRGRGDDALGAFGAGLSRGGGGGVGAADILEGQTAGGRLGHRGRNREVRGRVRAANPSVAGSLDRSVIVRVIRSRTNAFRACYERQLQRQPNLGGRLSIAFTIGASGRVTSARVQSSTVGNGSVEACLVRQVQRMRFPAPAGGGSVRVTYPFIFNTNEGTSSAPPVAQPPRPPPSNRRGGQWMRRERYSVGEITERVDVSRADRRRVEAAEAALSESPDSRDRRRALARALSRAGELERAEAAVREWIERDQLDPEALTLLADVLGRSGERTAALRLLTGVVDLAPDNVVLHQRLARAFERADDPKRACAHRVALAEIESDDVDAVADAVRCERALSRDDAAARLVASIADEARRSRVEARAGEAATRERTRGAITLDATWTGDADVDLTLVTPQGTRISWMGGRRSVFGADGSNIGHESLGLARASAGSYLVEVTRADESDTTELTGSIRLRAFGERQTIPFRLGDEPRRVVARIDVERRTRAVQMR